MDGESVVGLTDDDVAVECELASLAEVPQSDAAVGVGVGVVFGLEGIGHDEAEVFFVSHCGGDGDGEGMVFAHDVVLQGVFH